MKKFKDYFDKLKEQLNNKRMGNLIIIFLFAVLLFVFAQYIPSGNNTSTSKDNQSQNSISQDGTSADIDGGYEASLQNELKDTLKMIKGVGNVEVMIYFESGYEKIPVFNSSDSVSTSEETDQNGGKRTTTQKNTGNNIVMANDGSNNDPFITKTLKPKITGVLVVAEGASDKTIASGITQAVMNLFNLQENNVKVYPMAKI